MRYLLPIAVLVAVLVEYQHAPDAPACIPCPDQLAPAVNPARPVAPVWYYRPRAARRIIA